MTILISLAVCAGWSELLICNIHKVHFHWTQIIMSTTICTDPGVSSRNHLDTCIYVWEPMENTAHGYVISRGSSWLLTWRKQRKRSVIPVTPSYLEHWTSAEYNIISLMIWDKHDIQCISQIILCSSQILPCSSQILPCSSQILSEMLPEIRTNRKVRFSQIYNSFSNNLIVCCL